MGNPSYLVIVCPNCVAIRHFKPKSSDTYCCPVCGFKVSYNNGVITKISIPKKFNKIRGVGNV